MPQVRKSALAHCIYLPDRPILSSAETARLLGFPTQDALAKARLRGRLQIPMFRIQGRRGWFASTDDVRQWLQVSLESPEYPGSREGRT